MCGSRSPIDRAIFTRFTSILMGRHSRLEVNGLQHQSAGGDKHRTRFRVRYAETDQMGVVYYANYLIWMEIGRVELVRARGFDYKQLEAEGLFLSVIDANCHYLHPARYDQEITVQTEVVNSSSRTIEFAYQIRSADPDRLLAQGSTRHI